MKSDLLGILIRVNARGQLGESTDTFKATCALLARNWLQKVSSCPTSAVRDFQPQEILPA